MVASVKLACQFTNNPVHACDKNKTDCGYTPRNRVEYFVVLIISLEKRFKKMPPDNQS